MCLANHHCKALPLLVLLQRVRSRVRLCTFQLYSTAGDKQCLESYKSQAACKHTQGVGVIGSCHRQAIITQEVLGAGLQWVRRGGGSNSRGGVRRGGGSNSGWGQRCLDEGCLSDSECVRCWR